jgi:hypothetical protein
MNGMTTHAASATSSSKTDPIAQRCREILDQMHRQIMSQNKAVGNAAREARIRADLTKLVHWALHKHGSPDIVNRILDCYRRCAVDIDDTAVMRKARGVIKGEMRKAGIDTTVPGLDSSLDVVTIMLTTRLTIQRMGGASSTTSAPGPALDRKTSDSGHSAPRPAVPEPAPPAPHTVRNAKPPTTKRKTASQAEMLAAFERVVEAILLRVRQSGHNVVRADYLAAVYNDPAGKERLVTQVAATLPSANRTTLGQAIDGFFRNGFKGAYIERTDRQGNRRAHKR